MSKHIVLTQFKHSILDDEDFRLFSKNKWCAMKSKKSYYAIRKFGEKTLYLHREILKCKTGEIVDHINGNGLDNRKNNLRICSNAENSRNRKILKHSSKYKGVYWNKSKNKWHAQICFNYKNINLGYFKNEMAAAFRYDLKAKALFGQYASTNFLWAKKSLAA